jgi:hypothetical protein
MAIVDFYMVLKPLTVAFMVLKFYVSKVGLLFPNTLHQTDMVDML